MDKQRSQWHGDQAVKPKSSASLSTSKAILKISEARKAKATVLDLSGLDLTSVPDELWELTQLEELDIGKNNLKALPQQIGRLARLTKVILDYNNLDTLPESIGTLTKLVILSAIKNRITKLPKSIGKLSELMRLNLANNRLSTIPSTIENLRYLQELDLTDNQLNGLPLLAGCSRLVSLFVSLNPIGVLPDWLGRLIHLENLSASGCRLKTVEEGVYGLRSLRYLSLSDNPLVELPSGISRLKSLVGLNLGATPIVSHWSARNVAWSLPGTPTKGVLRTLPKDIKDLTSLRELYLHGQSALALPPEVLGPSWIEARGSREAWVPANPAGILDYYIRTSGEGAKSRPLNEAKMILVGRGGVGKTSLVNRLVHSRFSAHEIKTDGISITPWSISYKNEQMRLNIWDFGGQEIMHSTHQFFMTKRSLYLLVINAREGEQDANVEYWLRLIKSFGENSPIIVVINKIGDHSFDLNRRGLIEKFPSIKGFFPTDCATNSGLSDLRLAILKETDRLDHFRDPFPSSWFAVKDRLANLRVNENKDFIPFTRYQELCVGYGIVDSRGQETLVGSLVSGKVLYGNR
jgi:internalin A